MTKPKHKWTKEEKEAITVSLISRMVERDMQRNKIASTTRGEVAELKSLLNLYYR